MIAANSLSSTPVRLAWRDHATEMSLSRRRGNAAVTAFFLLSISRSMVPRPFSVSPKIAPIRLNRLFRHPAPRPVIQSP